jgi:hypothetical protein
MARPCGYRHDDDLRCWSNEHQDASMVDRAFGTKIDGEMTAETEDEVA